MRALTVQPGLANSIQLETVPEPPPSDGAVLVRALADARSLAYGPAIQVRCLECGFAEPADAAPEPKEVSGLAALLAFLR